MKTGPLTRRSSLVAHLLAIALLAGQVGAVAHASSHLTNDPNDTPHTAQVCLACQSFAPLTAAVGSSPGAMQLDPCAEAVIASGHSTQVPDGPAHRAYRSRAPPVLL